MSSIISSSGVYFSRAWQPTPVFLPGKSHGQRSLVGYSPWGRKELDLTEQLTLTLDVYFNFRESSDLRSSQVTHSWRLRESLAERPGHLDPRWDHFPFSLECSPGLGEGLAGCVALQPLLCPLVIPFLNFTDVDLQQASHIPSPT